MLEPYIKSHIASYIDQDYSLIDDSLNVYKRAQSFNTSALLEPDIKIRLNRFLFGGDGWNKKCNTLSDGERKWFMLFDNKRKIPGCNCTR